MAGVLSDTRVALAARLSTIDEIQASPLFLADPSPPACHVFPAPIDYDVTFQRGVDDYLFTIQVFVSEAGGDENAQDLLDEYLEPFGPRSIKAVLEESDSPDGSSVTLGGIIDDLRVIRVEGYRLYLREGRAPVLGSEWIVGVSASGREE